MPKEYVYGENHGQMSSVQYFTDDGEPKSSPVEEIIETFCVKVGWNKEVGHVQIATIDPKIEESFEHDRGLYVSLDRRGINDVIRLLRKARDQAFGRDE